RVIDSSLANPRSLAKDGSAHSGRTDGPPRRFPGLTGSTFAPACSLEERAQPDRLVTLRANREECHRHADQRRQPLEIAPRVAPWDAGGAAARDAGRRGARAQDAGRLGAARRTRDGALDRVAGHDAPGPPHDAPVGRAVLGEGLEHVNAERYPELEALRAAT